MNRTRSSLTLLPSAIALLLLAGCANPDKIPPGQSETEVLQKYGRPLAEVPIAGGKRLQYVNPPFAQTGYMVDLDTNGRVLRAEQVMNDVHFGRVKIGQDNICLLYTSPSPRD